MQIWIIITGYLYTLQAIQFLKNYFPEMPYVVSFLLWFLCPPCVSKCKQQLFHRLDAWELLGKQVGIKLH